MYNGPPQPNPQQPNPQQPGPQQPGPQQPGPQQPTGPGAPPSGQAYPGQIPPGQYPPGQNPQGRAPAPRRGGTGRTVAITVAATLGVYALAAGAVWMVTSSSGASVAGPEFDGLPTDPCAAATSSELNGIDAVMPSATFSESRSSCWWGAEFSDGTYGSLNVNYRFATDRDDVPLRDESETEEVFADEAADLLDGDGGEYWSIEVEESRTLDLGDESVVSHYLEGGDEKGSNAKVLVRVGDLLVEVSATEDWTDRTGRSDFTADEETLLAIAERAVAQLE